MVPTQVSNAEVPLLQATVRSLRGVGTDRAALLERLGVRTLEDLLLLRPRRYEDRRRFCSIGEIAEKGPVTVRGRIVTHGVKRFRQRSRSVYQMVLEDGTGRLHCRWWNSPFLEDQFAIGMELMIHGRVVDLKPRTIDHPETEVVEEGEEASVHMGRIVPIHPLTEGMSARWLRGKVWGLLGREDLRLDEPGPCIPRGGLPTRAEAIRWLHFPPELGDAELARRRLAFDEFVALQWEIQNRRRRLLARASGVPCGGDNRWIRPLLGRLGFRLTEAQTRVLREIRADLASGLPMRRLLQGDVGSGKTVVAGLAALMVLESGYDVALMAPTEILATQHARRITEWFAPFGIVVDLHTGAIKRQAVGSSAAGGNPRITVGTHALLESGYDPERLGLVVIDEQHKFGVAQREGLLRKGRCPHLLVMTATPIPRTLALTAYGDLDLSVIGERPSGRGRIRTFIRGPEKRERVASFVREQLTAGRQAYVVMARVEEDSAGEVKAVTRAWHEWAEALAPHRVASLHGRMAPEEKDRILEAFRDRQVQVLVATSVIEVGIDVPNATMMVIENAEQFGLAQLHQLRGRIGRGAHESVCVLLTAKLTEDVQSRLGVLERSQDGFEIAEADLRLRGAGNLLGQEQSGLPPFRFAELGVDRELLELARVGVASEIGKVAERRTLPP